eukprot:TRINITY_DN40323_c0_g1_i1.p1 TRINITY_DN40323_c0_g1~~TRINITY_DN40323_c0_g1_i1.p1  ORF type:complete len:165 (+),score=37.40 TRINITY_DN40323_c0_g1_i1:22-495(+)
MSKKGLSKRILKEVQRLHEQPPPGITALADSDNLRYLQVTLDGPPDSPYEGGKFKLEVFLPEGYPLDPPKCRFLTKIYHPNIDKLGRICLDVLKDRYTPALQVRSILLSIQSLLADPNPDDPLDNTVADKWKNENEAAILEAKNWTELYATEASSSS